MRKAVIAPTPCYRNWSTEGLSNLPWNTQLVSKKQSWDLTPGSLLAHRAYTSPPFTTSTVTLLFWQDRPRIMYITEPLGMVTFKKELQGKRNYGLPNIQHRPATVLSAFTSVSSLISKPKPKQSSPQNPKQNTHEEGTVSSFVKWENEGHRVSIAPLSSYSYWQIWCLEPDHLVGEQHSSLPTTLHYQLTRLFTSSS